MIFVVVALLCGCAFAQQKIYSIWPESNVGIDQAIFGIVAGIKPPKGNAPGQCMQQSAFSADACLCQNVRFDPGQMFKSTEFEQSVLQTLDLVHFLAPSCLDFERYDLLDRVTQLACSAFQRPCKGGETSGVDVVKMCRSECEKLHEEYEVALNKRIADRKKAFQDLPPRPEGPTDVFNEFALEPARLLCAAVPKVLLDCTDNDLFSDDEATCVRTKPLAAPLRDGLVECKIANSKQPCDLGLYHDANLQCTTPTGQSVPLRMETKDRRLLFQSPESMQQHSLPMSFLLESKTNKHVRFAYELNLAADGQFHWPTTPNPNEFDYYFTSLRRHDLHGRPWTYTCDRVKNGLPQTINVSTTAPFGGKMTVTFEQFDEDRSVNAANGLPEVFVSAGAVKTSLTFEGWLEPWQSDTNRIGLAMTLRFGPHAGLSPDVLMLPPPELVDGERHYMFDVISPIEVPGISLRFRQPIYYQRDKLQYSVINGELHGDVVWPKWGVSDFGRLIANRGCPRLPLEVEFDRFENVLTYDPDFKFIVSPNSDRERYERARGVTDIDSTAPEPAVAGSGGATAAIVIVVLLIIFGGLGAAFFVYRRRASQSDLERSGAQ